MGCGYRIGSVIFEANVSLQLDQLFGRRRKFWRLHPAPSVMELLGLGLYVVSGIILWCMYIPALSSRWLVPGGRDEAAAEGEDVNVTLWTWQTYERARLAVALTFVTLGFTSLRMAMRLANGGGGPVRVAMRTAAAESVATARKRAADGVDDTETTHHVNVPTVAEIGYATHSAEFQATDLDLDVLRIRIQRCIHFTRHGTALVMGQWLLPGLLVACAVAGLVVSGGGGVYAALSNDTDAMQKVIWVDEGQAYWLGPGVYHWQVEGSQKDDDLGRWLYEGVGGAVDAADAASLLSVKLGALYMYQDRCSTLTMARNASVCRVLVPPSKLDAWRVATARTLPKYAKWIAPDDNDVTCLDNDETCDRISRMHVPTPLQKAWEPVMFTPEVYASIFHTIIFSVALFATLSATATFATIALR